MPRPSNKDLQRRVGELQMDLAYLSTDEDYNVLTHKALPLRLRREAESARYVVLVRVENFSELLSQYGRESLVGSIRRMANMRSSSVLIRSRWLAENELVFVLSGEPVDFCNRLRDVAKNEGLKISTEFVPFSGNINFDHKRMAQAMPSVRLS